MKKVALDHLFWDVVIIIASICLAVYLAQSELLEVFLRSSGDHLLLSSFIAGLFFTSVFTTVPALVILGELSQQGSVILVALFGACGALIGDLIIFKFIRDRFADDILAFWHHAKEKKSVHPSHYVKLFRWVSIVAGGIIIASPLPDELGIGLMGFSKLRMSVFIPISLIFNFGGIFLAGLVATAL